MDDPRKMDPDREAGAAEPVPLDVKLLGEAIVELNLSRKNVGLYPPGHYKIIESIDAAYGLLVRILEGRTSITVGIAKDSLIVDDVTLDKKNPTFRECAISYHDLGLSAIGFMAGLQREDLLKFHEVLTAQEVPSGKELVERLRESGAGHIALHAIDFTRFTFFEGSSRAGVKGDSELFEDYARRLLDGTLGPDESQAFVEKLPPEEAARIINSSFAAADDAAVERLVGAYAGGGGASRLSLESVQKLMALIEMLGPDIKEKFLTKTFDNFSVDVSGVEGFLRTLTPENMKDIVSFFTKNNSLMPDSLKNVIYKLSSIKHPDFRFDMSFGGKAIVHDIELGEDLSHLFDEDHFDKYVSSGYKTQLERIVGSTAMKSKPWIAEIVASYQDDIIDSVAAEIMIEVIEDGAIGRDDYLGIVTRLTELASEFIEIGRFEDTLNIYTTILSHSLHGDYAHEARSTIDYYFHGEGFVSRLIEAIKLVGRERRSEVNRLVRAMKRRITGPLFESLVAEPNAGRRKFLLGVIASLKDDALGEILPRLKDTRWYVVRNMIYLIRFCDVRGTHLGEVRRLAKNDVPQVAIEAVRTLLHFKAKDASAYLKVHIESDDALMREQALSLAGTFRVNAVVPFLIEQLTRKDRTGAHPAMRAPVVKALGQIADPAAIPSLKEILESRPLLNRAASDELKAEILGTLANYPPHLIKPLVDRGLHTGNAEHRALYARLFASLTERERKPSK
jgi:hypothetical protein